MMCVMKYNITCDNCKIETRSSNIMKVEYNREKNENRRKIIMNVQNKSKKATKRFLMM